MSRMCQRKMLELNCRSVVFHHDNAGLHTSKMTLDKLKQLKSYYIAFTILFGYHNLSLFVSVIIKLRLSKITSPHSLFLKNHIIFFKCGIYKLVEHWKMMLANTSLINKDFFTITTAQLLFTNRT